MTTHPRLLFAALWLLPAALVANEPYVPPDLEPWVDWVLEDTEVYGCPFLGDADPASPDSRICAWPGALEIDVSGNAATFRQRWTTARDAYVELPGSLGSWPEGVTVDGAPATVVGGPRNAPRLWLVAGEHEVAGTFRWDARPATLRVPGTVGMIRLAVDGTAIDLPQRNGGALWLGERPRETAAPETVGIRVYRLLHDGLPKVLETRLVLEVSGRSREVVLARALPEGFVPMGMHSALPARIDPDGRLRLQVRAGRWELGLTARATTPEDRVVLDPGAGDWAEEEIWSWQADPRLRITEPSGPARIDPEEARVPDEWLYLPAFRLTAGEALTVSEQVRGGQAGPGNALALVRELWPDFDRGGWTALDRITGTMVRDWRIDMAAPWSLASASSHGRNLLVTEGETGGTAGVELRAPYVELEAVSRLDDGRGQQATGGWQTAFESLQTFVTLPRGQMLLHASGADEVQGSWLSRWQLMDFFLVLLIVVAIARLCGPGYAALAFLMLVVTWHEPAAPRWAWLAALAAIALARVAPAGRLQRGAVILRAVTLAALLVAFLPWAGHQARLVLYPQLDAGAYGGLATMLRERPAAMVIEEAEFDDASTVPGGRVRAIQGEAPNESVSDMMHGPLAARFDAGASEEDYAALLAPGPAYARLSPYAPDAVVQAGPGIPSWQGPRYRLDWNGRVTPDEPLRLFVLGETPYRLLRLLGIALAALILLRLAADAIRRLRVRLAPGAGAVPMLALLALTGMPADGQAAGAFPDERLLRELRTRLLAPPPCAPDCVSAAAAEIELVDDALTITLTVHAAAELALPAPWIDGWQPTRVALDGRADRPLQRGEDGVPRLRVPEGIHRVAMSGPVPAANELRLAFPIAPHRTTVTAPGWEVGGLQNGRIANGSLQLTRRVADGTEMIGLEPSSFPAFVEVTRRLILDVDWRLETRVVRIAPEDAPFAVGIPMVPGERPRLGDEDEDARLEVRDGEVHGAIGLGAPGFRWVSDLAPSATLTLTAPDDLSREELWEVAVGSMWRVRFEGTPALESPDPADRYRAWIAQFRPAPGEQLTLRVERVVGVPGETLALEDAQLEVRPGARMTQSTLSIGYDSTRGGRHTLVLPGDADVTAVRADGEPLGIRPEDGRLSLPVEPGSHRLEIEWQQDTDGRTRIDTPTVDFGAPVTNLTQRIHAGDGRWALFARGPGQGPAILYWSELALFLVIAVLLGRTRYAPVQTHEWLLLGLGFSTFSWGVLVLVAAWLFATGWRARAAMPASNLYYNGVQAGYAALTAVTLLALVSSVPRALLGHPRMQVAGSGSHDGVFSWFVDRIDGELPAAMLVSVPLWVYQGAILLWALWLAFAVIRWLRSAWAAGSTGGLWRGRIKPATDVKPKAG
jgi:hypothetical protein